MNVRATSLFFFTLIYTALALWKIVYIDDQYLRILIYSNIIHSA